MSAATPGPPPTGPTVARTPAPRWLKVSVIVLVVIGGVFRFSGLGDKFFWFDETHTGLAISGTSWNELRSRVFDGKVHGRGDYLDLLFPRPDTDWLDTIRVLYRDEPKHPPLYFLAARAWVQEFGSSIAVLRSLSAAFGMVALALVYLLVRQLSADESVAWIAVGLVAVSPLHLAYSQEARTYMLWLDLVILACWLLVRALRSADTSPSSAHGWLAGYTAVTALALYSHLLTLLVMAAQLLFVSRDRAHQATGVLGIPGFVRWTAASQCVASVLFLPWTIRVIEQWTHRQALVAWAGTPVSFGHWIRKVVAVFNKAFLDLHEFRRHVDIDYIGAIPLLVAAACVLWGWPAASARARTLLLSVAGVTLTPFVLSDVVGGGWRTAVIRYHLPAVLALQLCVAFGIARLIRDRSDRRRRPGIAAGTMLAVCGVVSGLDYLRSDTWWNKSPERGTMAVAAVVNGSPRPLLIVVGRGSRGVGAVMSLAPELEDHVRMLAVRGPRLDLDWQAETDVFVWRVPDSLRAEVAAQGYRFEPAGPPRLDRLRPP